MSGAETCEPAVHSWADEAVPLRRGHHDRRPAIASAPRAGVSRAIAIVGLCAFAFGLLAVLITTLHDGSGSPPQSRSLGSRQQGKTQPHHPGHSIGRRDQSATAPPTVERHQASSSAKPEPVRTQPSAPVKSDPSPSPPPTTAMPATASPPSSTPAPPARPEFGL
jgi:cell division septation protein DedD